jgi:hypothetical protein
VTAREFCRRILESGNLEAKLAPPVGSSGEDLPDELASPEAPRGPQRGIHRVRARRPLFTGAISRALVEAQ